MPRPADSRLVSTAHLMIANPLRREGLAALFSTHPPVHRRVARPRAMAGRYHLAYR
jgi:heat shock protein HtpX